MDRADEEELRRELLARSDRDQAACARVKEGGLVDEQANASLDAIVRENADWLKPIVAVHGWPGWRSVGVDGAHAAWLLVQHADHDVAFQRSCLDKLDAAVKAGDASPESWAYLVDRVAVNEGRKQTYGTQFDEHREPRPIENEAHVDERRRSVGLDTLADYRLHMWSLYGPPK